MYNKPNLYVTILYIFTFDLKKRSLDSYGGNGDGLGSGSNCANVMMVVIMATTTILTEAK